VKPATGDVDRQIDFCCIVSADRVRDIPLAYRQVDIRRVRCAHSGAAFLCRQVTAACRPNDHEPSSTHRARIDGNVIDAIFQTWLRCSDTMQLMANANGAAFLEIVHPNPYHSKKKLTLDEIAELSSVPATEYIRRASVQGYDLIEQRSDMLESRGIVSAIALFDDSTESIYIDSSGHFSKPGEMIFRQFIADKVAAKLSSGGRHAHVN
jgi:hypothetical protein